MVVVQGRVDALKVKTSTLLPPKPMMQQLFAYIHVHLLRVLHVCHICWRHAQIALQALQCCGLCISVSILPYAGNITENWPCHQWVRC